jgi:hypothetical protein
MAVGPWKISPFVKIATRAGLGRSTTRFSERVTNRDVQPLGI